MKMLLSWIGNVISPPTCVCCHCFLDIRFPLCVHCEDALEPVLSCELMVTPSYMLKVFAVTEYVGVIRSLVMAKQSGNRLASRQLGQLIAKRALYSWQECDGIVPVPLHWLRYAWRGFNQSYEIAQVLSEEHGIDIINGVTRTRSTAYQASLERKERMHNVRDGFQVDDVMREQIRGKHLVIVDDVMTTGATLVEVARALARCKPASLSAVVAARVVLK